ncbi:unnamed protein product [Caenorhabditis nigoni]|uniref:Uncharacterized protein n=1 Tax=Caenorhabditis nigoni TaxID=1611254 RepID=A0A2G5VL09_9PELO|nr:hypothetical protein B9Z55_002563 [Caenorhabditis nigoni]
MIAKLLYFVLKSSLFIVNATLVSVILIGCADGKKNKNDTHSPPPTANTDDVTVKKSVNQNSTTSTELEPPKQAPSCSTSTPSQPTSQPVSKAKTPDRPDETKNEKTKKSEMKLDKTQRMASKESLRPPPRTIRNAPVKKVTSKEAQKTLKDVKEFSAREGPILGEKSANQQDFDDYLNNLGENKT